jgi:hypothetical protein
MTENEKAFFAQYLEFISERKANKQPEERIVELAATDGLVRGFDEFRQRLK